MKEYLDIREMNGYSIQHAPFHPADGSAAFKCLVYIGLLLIGMVPTAMAGLVTSARGVMEIRFFVGILGGTFVPCQVWSMQFFDKNIVGTANGLMAGIGNVTKHGFLVRKGDALERLAGVSKIAFDKTGTLTYGLPQVTALWAEKMATDERQLYTMAAAAEALSEHPLGKAVVRGFQQMYGTELPTAEHRGRVSLNVTGSRPRRGQSSSSVMCVGDFTTGLRLEQLDMASTGRAGRGGEQRNAVVQPC